jgi:glycosyltransferase involved in cell wall biosynthesis
MNVTFTTYDAPGYVGGPNSWLRRLIPFLQQAGWRVEVLFFIEHGRPEDCPYYKALTEQGISCRATSCRESMFKQVRWLLQQLAHLLPSVLVVNMAPAGYLASRWARRAGIPTIGILHSDDEMYEKIFEEFALGPTGNRVSDMVSVSDFLAQTTGDANTDTKMHLIPYGVPIPERIAKPPGETIRLIYVGRLVEEQKQILGVTKALCRVVREVEGAEAIIYGDGYDRPRVMRCIERENVGNAVRLGGNIDNSEIQKVMLEANILVLLSDYEGLPVALLEAMACGVVPVCLNIRSGVGQLIEQGKTGFLVEDRGDEFVSTISDIATDPKSWTRISRAAKKSIASQYSDELNAKRWLQLLRDSAADSSHSEASKESLLRGISTLDFLKVTVSEHNDKIMNAK